MMEVKTLVYNWVQEGSVHDREGAGADWKEVTIGVNGVKSIAEHKAQGEGDKWNYLVGFEDGHSLRIFNPNLVEYLKPTGLVE